ncbi:ABC transporter G family member 34 [Phytophthora cactorum]|uniref:ABC transporter G family member 34 n=1 Tax=Phytophthora cactorum TaxID=29920 RepID=A0A329RQF5_9STRA|nr:ABC transporter G family member 34 [Phytophthora cactorum]
MGAEEKNIKSDSGAGLMVKGPEALHDHMLSNIESATGRSMPRMDVRFTNLSVAADIVVVEDDGSKQELPTLPNTVKKAFAGPKKRSVRKQILKNVSGVFKPGTITLLLGQPGSGKSALLKMLSARFSEAKNILVEGDITFNNVPRDQIRDRLPQFVSYTDQRDKHFAPLTVKETLDFAYQVCGGDITKRKEFIASLPSQKENQEALQATKSIFQHYPDVIIQQLGLKNCQDTIVGDAMIRGVSGGERKRVTTGEMEFGMKFVSLMDEISTGLDSAATFDIIKTQRSIAHKLNKTVVIALLQPSPEIFALFDNVMILNEGELMYHGPVNKVEGYFEDLGFKCPPERDIADYLLDLGTRQQYRYEVEQGSKAPRLPEEFGDSFRQSALYQETLAALIAPHDPELLRTVKENMDPMPMFQQSFMESTAALFRREIMISYRNKAFIFGRLLMILVMGLLFSTIYYDFDPTQVSVVTGVVFSSVMFLSMGQSSQLPVFMANRDIFYKQRGANFYRTSSYVLANSIAGIPLSLAETVIFGSLVYWMCGFAANVGLFILFEVILLLSNMAMGMWFFFLSSVCSHENIATPLCMMSILVFIIFAGFIVTTDEIPDYLIWAHWISPMSWSIKALSINQYRSSAYDVCVYGAIDYCTDYGFTMGEYYLNLFGLDTGKEWVWYGVIYLAAIYVVFMILSVLALEHLRYEAPTNVDVSDKSVDESSYALLQTPKGSSTLSDAVEVQVNTQEKNFVPVTVAFQDLHYWVPDPKNPKGEQLELLKGINGFAVPGSITALMGSSGAGKTTLMDVIAGRKTGGRIAGKILLNGYEANDLAIRRCTGYCEQMDVHSEAATIREALTFSSFLRQDASIPDAKNLLLLKRGGETVFYGNLGKKCRNLIDYFEGVPGVAPLPKDYNPATWMLECIGAGVNNSAADELDFVDYFSKSSYYEQLKTSMAKEGITVPSPDLPEIVFDQKRAASSATQMKFVVTRFFQMYWRTPSYTLTRLIMSLFLALIFGIVFINPEYASYAGLSSGVGMVFMAALFLSMMAFNSVIPLTSSERPSFYRERASQTYNAFWYWFGATLVEIPWCFASGLMFTVVLYPLAGFTEFLTGILFWVAISLTVFMQVSLGQFFTYAMPTEEVAAIIGMLFNSTLMMFMGYNPPASSIPQGYQWLYTISPQKFPMCILVALVFTKCDTLPTWDETTQSYINVGSDLGCQPMANAPATINHTTLKEYTESYYGFKYDEIAQNFGIVLGCIALFRVWGLLALRFINHQKR